MNNPIPDMNEILAGLSDEDRETIEAAANVAAGSRGETLVVSGHADDLAAMNAIIPNRRGKSLSSNATRNSMREHIKQLRKQWRADKPTGKAAQRRLRQLAKQDPINNVETQ